MTEYIYIPLSNLVLLLLLPVYTLIIANSVIPCFFQWTLIFFLHIQKPYVPSEGVIVVEIKSAWGGGNDYIEKKNINNNAG